MKGYWRKLAVLMLALMLALCGCGNKNDDKTTEAETGTSDELTPLDPPVQIEDITEYVTLGQYIGVEAPKESAEVTDKEIEDAINALLDENADYEQIKEGTIAEGDTAGIDFVGKLDGVAFEGGTGSSELKIGSNSFIDGFEDGLIGVKVGETVDLNLTFPDPYKNNPDLAGKAVVFTVTVNYKLGTEKIRPEFDDALAKKLKYQNAEAMRENIVKELEEQKETLVESNYMVAIWDVVFKNSEIKKHDDIYNEYYENFTMQYENMASYYGVTLQTLIESYYGIKYEEFVKYAEEYATSCMQQELVCRAIVAKENITATDEECAELLAQYFKDYGTGFKDEAEMEAYYGKERLKHDILLQKAIDRVVDNAVAVEPSEETTAAAE